MSGMPKRPMLATPTEERTYVRRLKERIRALEDRVKDLEAQVETSQLDSFESERAVLIARAEKAEAALETPKGKHDCPWCAAGRYHLNAHQRDSLGREDERMTYEIPLENDPDQLTTGDTPAMRRAAARMASLASRSAENEECGT